MCILTRFHVNFSASHQQETTFNFFDAPVLITVRNSSVTDRKTGVQFPARCLGFSL